MVIKKINNQHRRDFSATLKCESCEQEQELTSGYDDVYYHNEVLPNIKCKSCGESTNSAGKEINPKTPKYPEGMQI